MRGVSIKRVAFLSFEYDDPKKSIASKCYGVLNTKTPAIISGYMLKSLFEKFPDFGLWIKLGIWTLFDRKKVVSM